MNFWGGGYLRYPEREDSKKIVKKNKKSEIIDRKRKNRERVIGCLPFFWCTNNITLMYMYLININTSQEEGKKSIQLKVCKEILQN